MIFNRISTSSYSIIKGVITTKTWFIFFLIKYCQIIIFIIINLFVSKENKKAFLSSLYFKSDSKVFEVNPPNLLFPADLIIVRVFVILSHFE